MESLQKDNVRYDLQIIASWIEEGSSVLDLGCGTGSLLAWLEQHKNVRGTGVESNQDKAIKAIGRGLTILQGDLNEEIQDFPDKSFDYVILSQTLQQVYEPATLLSQLARIGKKVVVSFPNFSHIRIRLVLFFTGLAPKNNQLPYSWYDTPNIRVITLKDFRKFAREMGYTIIKELAINTDPRNEKGTAVRSFINLRATYGIFLIEENPDFLKQ